MPQEFNTREDISGIRRFYQDNVYGQWREGEKVTFEVNRVSKRTVVQDPSNPFANMFRLSTTDEGIDVVINVESGEKTGSFTVRAYLPQSSEMQEQKSGKAPFIVCMHPVQPKDYALSRGYAVIFMDTAMIAEDNNLHKGCFYDLYPYTEEPKSQTGDLMAWAWGAAKVLDAVNAGLDKVLGLDPQRAAVTGVSRWGKATAVCGAFDKRFEKVIPACSGAGGLALWNYKSEGKTYDLTMCGGPKEYTYTQNEPLSCLQSDSERGWFCDRFLEFKEYADIPVEQYMLPVLAADASRQYYIVGAWMGEDWTNAPAMWSCYEKAADEYEKLGLLNHIHAVFHKEGHALLQEDLERIL